MDKPSKNMAVRPPAAHVLKERCQRYGMLVVFSSPDLRIQSVSENSGDFLGKEPTDIVGTHLSQLVGEAQATKIAKSFQQGFMNTSAQWTLPIDIPSVNKRFLGLLNQEKNTIFLTIEPFALSQALHGNPYALLKAAIHSLKIAKSLEELYQQATDILCQSTGYDKVRLHIFEQGGESQVVAESGNEKLPSFIGHFFPAKDFDTEFKANLLASGIHFWANLHAPSVAIYSLSKASLPGQYPLQPPNSYQHELAKNMGAASGLIISISLRGSLWGMIVCHNSKPLFLPHDVRAFAELFGQVLAGQITEKIEEKKAKGFQRKNAMLNHLIEQVSSHGNFAEALLEQKDAYLGLVDATGGALCYRGQVHLMGKTPPIEKINQLTAWLDDHMDEEAYQDSNISSKIPGFKVLKNTCSGVTAAVLSKHQHHYLLWFRPETVKVVKWAGEPKHDVFNQTEEIPRTSFFTWTQLIHSHSILWDSADLVHVHELRKIIVESVFRQVQEEVQQNEKFRLMFQNSSDLLVILNESFQPKYISDSVQHVLGYPLPTDAELIGQLIHPQDYPGFVAFLRAVRDKTAINNELVYRVKNAKGEYIFLETIANNQLDNPYILGIICNSRDITSRVLANKRLQKFQKVIEASLNGILFVDAKEPMHPVTYANPGFSRITGFSREEVVGKPCLFFNPEEVEEETLRQIWKALAEKKECEVLIKSKKKDGGFFWNKMQLFTVEDKLNLTLSYIIVITDTTHWLDAEEKLRDYTLKLNYSNQELQTFAYVASHDLQEPLRTIAGFSELLAESYQGQLDQEADEYIQFILQATARMKTLIKDLLEFSRVTTVKEYIAEVNLNEVVNMAIENLHLAIEESEAVVNYVPMPTVMINETLVLQVFQNLISNALKYRKETEPPCVDISCAEHDFFWQISIRDNGIGIDNRYLDRIFVIFQRLHTKEEYSGTGIGLAICKKIIEKYGGRIWVESSLGEGSTFHFTIPKELQLD